MMEIAKKRKKENSDGENDADYIGFMANIACWQVLFEEALRKTTK